MDDNVIGAEADGGNNVAEKPLLEQMAEEQAAASGNLVIAARNPTRECMITRTCKQHPDLRFRGTP